MAAGVDVQTVQKMSLTVKDTPIHGADSELSVEVNPQENSKTRYILLKPVTFIQQFKTFIRMSIQNKYKSNIHA